MRRLQSQLIVGFVKCLCVFSAMFPSALSADSRSSSVYTADEVKAQFLQNALKAKTIRVNWSVSYQASPDFPQWAYSRTRLRINKAALQKGSVPKADVEKLKQAISWLESQEKPTSPYSSLMCQDFWSDRNTLQWRLPHTSNGDLEKPFPDQVLSSSNLLMQFSGFRVTSRNSRGLWKSWIGTGPGHGNISDQVLTATSNTDVFPPLALPKEEWSPSWRKMIHPIDEFFEVPWTSSRDEGLANIGGRDVHVLTAVMNDPHPEIPQRIIRAFIPDDCPASIPIRIEIFQRDKTKENLDWLEPASKVDQEKHQVSWILRDIIVEEISPGFFYPISGYVDEFGITPDHDSYDIKGLVGVVYATTKWEARKTEINREMPESMFDFEFPTGTVIQDGRKGEIQVVDADGYAQRMTAGWTPPERKPEHWFSWYLKWVPWPYTVAAVLVLVGGFAVLRQRRKAVKK